MTQYDLVPPMRIRSEHGTRKLLAIAMVVVVLAIVALAGSGVASAAG